MITSLGHNDIFVFGSNEAGIHGAGAAWQARHRFGAKLGIGEGLTGQCYAFPTLDRKLHKRSHGDLQESCRLLFECAGQHPEKRFLLTKVGCGLAGFDESYMRSLFVNAPENIILPEDWREQ
jgi:hypothetical protein